MCRLSPVGAGPVLAALIAAVAVSTMRVEAWGRQGHRLVARIAAERLTPVARRNVAWLIGPQALADVASWADDFIDGNEQTAFWHYINIPPDATTYDRDRDCPRQPGVAAGAPHDKWRDCVVDRIPFQHERLGNVSLDRADRAVALKFLVHFVGDLHQPFHALGVERGGNGIKVSAFGAPDCGGDPARPYPCNLHVVWDSMLTGHRNLDDEHYLAALRDLIRTKHLESRPPGTAVEWALQSRSLARAALLPQAGNADEAYYRANIAIVDERLALAGLRLADLLNRALTSPPPAQ